MARGKNAKYLDNTCQLDQSCLRFLSWRESKLLTLRHVSLPKTDWGLKAKSESKMQSSSWNGQQVSLWSSPKSNTRFADAKLASRELEHPSAGTPVMSEGIQFRVGPGQLDALRFLHTRQDEESIVPPLVLDFQPKLLVTVQVPLQLDVWIAAGIQWPCTEMLQSGGSMVILLSQQVVFLPLKPAKFKSGGYLIYLHLAIGCHQNHQTTVDPCAGPHCAQLALAAVPQPATKLRQVRLTRIS